MPTQPKFKKIEKIFVRKKNNNIIRNILKTNFIRYCRNLNF